MGGKGGKTSISRYHMSQWWGVAMKVDAVLKVEYGEKVMWSGRVTTTQAIAINNENLYGGDKKEGGVQGVMTVLMGDQAQVLPDALAQRLGAASGADVPAARGVTSLFFTGNGRMSDIPLVNKMRAPGFYWAANSPYLKQLAVEVERIPRQLDPLTAEILRTEVNFPYDGMWKYKVVPPADGGAPGVPAEYISPSYDDSDWAEGPGGFGNGGPGGGLGVGTFIPAGVVGKGIWLRKRIDVLSPRAVGDLAITIYHDDGGWLWWNGSPIPITPTTDYYRGTAVVPNSLITESNVVVAQVLDSIPGGGPSYIYMGLAIVSAAQNIVDANPAHIIYECLIDTSWGLGEAVENIDVASFQSAATTLFNEKFGLSLVWDAASSIEDFVNNILSHINGVIFTHPATGLLTLRLVRDDYDTATVREITPDNSLLTKFSRKAWGDTINEVQVSWTDPEDEDASKVVLQDAGNIAQQGFINSSNSDYPGVRTLRLAGSLAERDLRAASAPLCTAEAETNRTFYDATPMEVVKLNWPEYGVAAVYARVTSVTYGEVGASGISLTLAEDIFSFPKAEYTAANPGTWTPPNPGEGGVTGTYIMPAPYYGLAAVAGQSPPSIDESTTYAVFLAAMDVGGQSTYDLYSETAQASGGTAYELVDDDRAFLTKASLPSSLSAAALTVVGGLPVAVNDVVILGAPSLGAAAQELALVGSVDEVTGDATLWRGIIDTTPKAWAAGTEIWCGRLEDLSADATARTAGATAKYKIIPAWGDTSLDGAAVVSAVVPTRAALPYPPANVKINATDAFSVSSATGAFTLTWAHRNKATQAEQILKQTDGSVPPEADIRYGVEVRDGAGAVLVSRNDVAGSTATIDLVYTGTITIKLWAIDDTGASFQVQSRSVAYTAGSAASNTITAPTYDPSGAVTIIDGGDLDA